MNFEDADNCYTALRKIGFNTAESLLVTYGLPDMFNAPVFFHAPPNQQSLVIDTVQSILEEDEKIDSSIDKLATQIYTIDKELLVLMLQGFLNAIRENAVRSIK